jgi:hypothetical protein
VKGLAFRTVWRSVVCLCVCLLSVKGVSPARLVCCVVSSLCFGTVLVSLLGCSCYQFERILLAHRRRRNLWAVPAALLSIFCSPIRVCSCHQHVGCSCYQIERILLAHQRQRNEWSVRSETLSGEGQFAYRENLWTVRAVDCSCLWTVRGFCSCLWTIRGVCSFASGSPTNANGEWTVPSATLSVKGDPPTGKICRELFVPWTVRACGLFVGSVRGDPVNCSCLWTIRGVCSFVSGSPTNANGVGSLGNAIL